MPERMPWRLSARLMGLDTLPEMIHNPRMTSDLTPAQFVAKWLPVKLPERAASQEHFLDLCRLLG